MHNAPPVAASFPSIFQSRRWIKQIAHANGAASSVYFTKSATTNNNATQYHRFSQKPKTANPAIDTASPNPSTQQVTTPIRIFATDMKAPAKNTLTPAAP